VTVGPDEKHWHGATPTTTMTHIAIQEALDGKSIERLERSPITNTTRRENPGRARPPRVILSGRLVIDLVTSKAQAIAAVAGERRASAPAAWIR
jgi:hypothetical protein